MPVRFSWLQASFRGCALASRKASGMVAASLLAGSLLMASGCREMKPPPGAEESATDLDVDMGGEAKDDAPEEPVAPQKGADGEKDAPAEKDAAAEKAPAAEKSDAQAEKPAGDAQ